MAEVTLSRADAQAGRLPALCVCCGEPAEEFRRHSFYDGPFGLAVLPLGYHLLVFSRIPTQLPVCALHRGHWRRRRLLVWGSLVPLLGVVGPIGLLAMDNKALPVVVRLAATAGLGLILMWPVLYLATRVSSVHPTRITKTQLTLSGVAERFVRAARLRAYGGPPGEPMRPQQPTMANQVRLDRARAAEGDLPPVCVCCGQEATVHVARTFVVRPPGLMRQLGPLASLVPLGERVATVLPVCDRHPGHWRRRRRIVSGTFAVLAGLAVFGCLQPGVAREIQNNPGLFVFLGLLAFLLWLGVVAACQATAVRAIACTSESLTLAGVAPWFARAVRQEEAGVGQTG